MDSKLLTLLDSTADQLVQLSTAILPLSDSSYTRESYALPGSTIGKHVRHILDHFSLLFAAISNNSQSLVNYSHRERNTATQESVAGGIASLQAMAELAHRLHGQTGITIRADDAITVADTMPGGSDEEFVSTKGRELWFCIHHMIHHNAIIASLMHEFGLHPPTQFAYAPSTIKHKPPSHSPKKQQQQQ